MMVEILASENATAVANFTAFATAAFVLGRLTLKWLRKGLALTGPSFRRAQQTNLHTQLTQLRKYRTSPLLLAYDVGASLLRHCAAFLCLSYTAAYAGITGYFAGAKQPTIDGGRPEFFEVFIRMPDVWLDVIHSTAQSIVIIGIFILISFYF